MSIIQHIKKGEGDHYDYAQDHCFVKVSSLNTDGKLSMVEDLLKPGFFLKRHQHKIMTEVFYILEGEVEFVLDDQAILLKAGDTLTIPNGVWHEVSCPKGGKMLTFFQNGRFDVYLQTLSQMGEADFADEAKMKALSEEFDIYEAS